LSLVTHIDGQSVETINRQTVDTVNVIALARNSNYWKVEEPIGKRQPAERIGGVPLNYLRFKPDGEVDPSGSKDLRGKLRSADRFGFRQRRQGVDQ
jgi:hypothetical protein